MKQIISIAIFLIFTLIGFGQTNSNHSYKKARVYLDNHRVLKASSLQMTISNATFLNSANNKQETIAMNNVRLVKIAKGSHLLDGALYGAGTLALTALLIDVQPDDPLGIGVKRKHDAGFYLGLTTGGAIVGALIGSLFPKWKTVYSSGKFIGLNLPVNLDFVTESNLVNIKIIISI